MISLSIILVMDIIKASSLGSTITIKYGDDNFILGLGVRNYMTEGQGKNQSLTGCRRKFIPRWNICQSTIVGHLVANDFFSPTSYVHMTQSTHVMGKIQCDFDYFKVSKPLIVPQFSHFDMLTNFALNPAFLSGIILFPSRLEKAQKHKQKPHTLNSKVQSSLLLK